MPCPTFCLAPILVPLSRPGELCSRESPQRADRMSLRFAFFDLVPARSRTRVGLRTLFLMPSTSCTTSATSSTRIDRRAGPRTRGKALGPIGRIFLPPLSCATFRTKGAPFPTIDDRAPVVTGRLSSLSYGTLGAIAW